MAWSLAPTLSTFAIENSSFFITSSTFNPSNLPKTLNFSKNCTPNLKQQWNFPIHKQLYSSTQLICKAAEYKFPDPIPEFAESEIEKFKTHLQRKLSNKDIFGDKVDEVVEICTEILDNFLHSEYGGPGTLLVIPFIDMADTLNERGLPGGPQAARIAVKWAQKNIDKDWEEWTSGNSK
ncbi:protein PLASTID REDOX INSENSITIVE 2-like isoform X2 [Chenopodium quinoa]|uniref:protein PLASTID REDOX INSENSITIVE 2-like isoform X2 n=1 Tax=Chenopodium quinoa TaxID=63459 RepID=UPI000B76FD17|nr:protein PLASTID REDOX INSENSITIVE 2-like isoform X2 [Chenopodium quinoa]